MISDEWMNLSEEEQERRGTVKDFTQWTIQI